MKDFLRFSLFVLTGGVLVGLILKEMPIQHVILLIGLFFIITSFPVIIKSIMVINKDQKIKENLHYNFIIMFMGIFMIFVGFFFILKH